MNKKIRQNARPQNVFGNVYDSISHLAREFERCPQLVAYHIRRGKSPEEAVQIAKRQPGPGPGRRMTFNVDGQHFASRARLAAAFGMTDDALRWRLNNGWSVEDAVFTPVKDNRPSEPEAFGQRYANVAEVARAHGRAPSTVIAAINRGMSLEDALVKRRRSAIELRTIVVELDGIRATVPEHIYRKRLPKRKVMRRWLEKGMTPEEALTSPFADHDDYAIYSITHRATGRMYVGATRNANARWKAHAKADTPIGQALREYGNDAFDFTIIDHAKTGPDAARKEREWIDRLHAATKRGFNVRPDTGYQPAYRSVPVGGRKFASKRVAAEEHGLSLSTVKKRIARLGITFEQAVLMGESAPTSERLVLAFGQRFRSESAFARHFHMDVGYLRRCLAEGLTPEQALAKKRVLRLQPVMIEGRHHSGKKEACTVYDVRYSAVHARMKRGVPFEVALLTLHRDKQWNWVGCKRSDAPRYRSRRQSS